MTANGNRSLNLRFFLILIVWLAAATGPMFPTAARAADFSLTTSIFGSGAVNNLQQGSPAFTCASPSTTCSVSAASGTPFHLAPTPSSLFDFAGWSGAGCSAGPCQLSLTGNTTLAAVFTPQPLLKRAGSTATYMSFSRAYGEASGGSEIRSRNAVVNGNVRFDRPIAVLVNGGFDEQFQNAQGFTTVRGSFHVRRGSVTASRIRIGATALADFAVEPPTAFAMNGALSGTSSIATTVTGGFNAAVALSASGVPAGATATFAPASIAAPGQGSSMLTVTAGASTPAGSYPISVSGTGGGKSHSQALVFTVAAAPVSSFAGSYSGSYSGADSGTVSVTISASGAITGSGSSTADPAEPYQFSVSGQVATGGSVSLTGTGSAGTATFTGTINAQGVMSGTWSDGATRSGTFTVTRSTAPVADFSMAQPAAVSATQGGLGTTPIVLSASGGFNAAVALTASNVPPGGSASFSPDTIAAPGSGSATLTLGAGPSTPAGTYSVTVTGTGGGKTHTATVSFTVAPGGGTGNGPLLADGFEAGGWSMTQVSGTEGSWSLVGTGTHPEASPHGGLLQAQFNSYDASSGSQTRLFRNSGIALPATTAPVTLSFWMYHDTDYSIFNDKVQAQVSTDGTNWTSVGDPVDRYDGSTGWAQVSIDLAAYKGQTVKIGFLGVSKYGQNVYLDDVAVTGSATASPDFGMSASPAVTAAQGGSGTATIETSVSGGFNAAVALAASDLPPGAAAVFTPASIAAPGTGSATLMLSAGATTPVGNHTITVTGSGGGKTHTSTVSFTVTAPQGSTSIVSASGSATFGFYPGYIGHEVVTGTFAPSADGFETEVSSDFTVTYRWIDKASNTRFEVRRALGASRPEVAFYRDPEPYVMGTGMVYPLGTGLCISNECRVTITGGTSIEKTVTVTFEGLKPMGTADTGVVNGSLTGSANDYIWTGFDFPASSSGSVLYNGQAKDVLSAWGDTANTTVNGVVYTDETFTVRMTDGSYISAKKYANPYNMDAVAQVARGVSINEFNNAKIWVCNSPVGGKCEFSSVMRSDGSTRITFPDVPITAYNLPSSLAGAVDFGQASSTLKVNGVPFPVNTTNYRLNNLASLMSAVGSTIRHEFNLYGGASSTVNSISIWVRNGVVAMLRIPGPNNSQFLCLDQPTVSTGFPWSAGPPHTIPKCPPISISNLPGEGFRRFHFDNVTLDVEPSVYDTPLKTLTLDGTLVAKGR